MFRLFLTILVFFIGMCAIAASDYNISFENGNKIT